MQILMNSGGIAMTNAFVIVDEASKQAVLFDAPDHTVEPLLDEVQRQGWDLIGLWLTHAHFDHVADHAVVKARFPKVKVLIHPLEVDRFRNPNRLFPVPFVIPAGEPDELVDEGKVLRIGSIEARVLHTPGHSPGHVMYHLPKEKVLVGGDLIIGGSVGRTDLPGCSADALEESIRSIMQLPDDTQLLPGHGDATTLGQERLTNPYVQAALNQTT